MPRKKSTALKATDTEGLLKRITELLVEAGDLRTEYELDNDYDTYEFDNSYFGQDLRLGLNSEGHYYLEDDNNGILDNYSTLFQAYKALDELVTRARTAKKTVVKNLTNYGDEATVDGGGITVGCRTISFEKFDELVKLVEAFRN